MASGDDVMQMLIARGLSPVQAAVIGGHVQQESGFNPSAFNEKEGARGALQWRLDRLDNLRNFASQRGASPDDLGTQMDFMIHEMDTTEKKAGDAFKSAADLPAMHAALKRYIRYGDNSDATRMANATALLGGAPATASGTNAPVLASAPFSLAAPTAEPDPKARADALSAIIKRSQEDNLDAVEPIHMAKPMGLNTVRRLISAMNRKA